MTDADDPAALVRPARRSGPRSVTVTGRVRAGVEHRSVVLAGDDGVDYQLGGSHAHLVGRRVTVTGRVNPDVGSVAQQGTVLRVDAVDPCA